MGPSTAGHLEATCLSSQLAARVLLKLANADFLGDKVLKNKEVTNPCPRYP